MRPGARRTHALAVLVAGAVGVAGGLLTWATDLAGSFESRTVAARFSLRHARPPADVVVVAIDDATFAALRERWPFRRTRHAQALDELRRIGARRVVYDVQFTEPSRPADDWALYRAVGRARGTVLATTDIRPGGHTNVLGGDERLAAIGARAAAANFPTEPGGEIGRVTDSWQGLPTLAVAAARSVGSRVDAGAFAGDGALISFAGPPGTVPTVSFGDLVRGRVDPALVRGRIAVVGATAPTLQDVHATPTSSDRLMSGAEVQANAIQTVLDGFPLRRAPGWLAVLCVLALGLAPALAALRLRALSAAVVPFVAAAYAVAAKLAFDAGLVLPVVAPLAGLAVGTIATVTLSYVAEHRERRRVSRHNELLEAAVRARTEELRRTQLEVVRRLGLAAEWRDEETGAHIERMSICCERLGLACGMTPDEAELLRHAAVLHDVGKIGVPDRVLLKEGPLDDAEWAIMRTHTTIGSSILSGSESPLIATAEVIARTHHERWDGSGYPAGLSGAAIPLAGRICAIADVFDALLSRRPYKDGWAVNAVVDELRAGAGTQFDPVLVERFLELAAGLARELHGAPAEAGDERPPLAA